MGAQDILRDALEDVVVEFELLEATFREGKLEPLAEIVRAFAIRAGRALDRADAARAASHQAETGAVGDIPGSG